LISLSLPLTNFTKICHLKWSKQDVIYYVSSLRRSLENKANRITAIIGLKSIPPVLGRYLCRGFMTGEVTELRNRSTENRKEFLMPAAKTHERIAFRIIA